MEVFEFVPAASVDPVYLDASYYVVPEAAGERPHALLYEVLRRSGYASIAQLTLQTREHLVLLRAGHCGLIVHTLFYSDEVRALDEFRTDTASLTDQELQLAQLLVEALTGPFEPAKYKDSYRENLRSLIDAKVRGEEVRLGIIPPQPVPAANILDALKASLARAKKPAAREQVLEPAVQPKRKVKVVAIPR